MDHKKQYPDISLAPEWLKTISVADGVVGLTVEQLELAGRNNPADNASALASAQRKFDNGGLDALREFLYQKSLTHPSIDTAVKLAASDLDMARIAEDLLVYLKGKFPEDDFTAVIGVKGMEKVNARRKVRGDTPL